MSGGGGWGGGEGGGEDGGTVYIMQGEQRPDCVDCFGASISGIIKSQLKHYKIIQYFVFYLYSELNIISQILIVIVS